MEIPVLNQENIAFPGESWFFYWRTSASLWESKIKEHAKSEQVIIPLNWSFHSETGETYDFGQNRPETNLKKLVDQCIKLDKRPVFFLPVTPVPFLANGGLPPLLARSISINPEELIFCAIDYEGKINKLHSFFDTRVFKAYSKYIYELGRYLTTENITTDLWGINCGYNQQEQFISYLEDRSKVFQQGLELFIQNLEDTDLSPDERACEQVLISKFTDTIKNLYCETAKNGLLANWEGLLNVAFLGGPTTSHIERMIGVDNQRRHSLDLFTAISNDSLPSSVLIPMKNKEGNLKKQLDQLVVRSLIHTKLKSSTYSDDEPTYFRPLTFFEIIEHKSHDHISDWWPLGLLNYFLDNYGRVFNKTSSQTFVNNSDSYSFEKIFFLHGCIFDDVIFRNMLNIFMNGGKVIIDKTNMPEKIDKRLETFFFENSLKVEKVNYQTVISNVALGEGRIVVFAGEDIKKLGTKQQTMFWSKLIQTFNIPHLAIDHQGAPDFIWRTRGPRQGELSYEEVRRLSFYNSTSYKKKVHVDLPKNFVLMKVLDEINTTVRSNSNELNIEVLPGGSVSLDFGLYS
ncbi:MAG: hypothetical protein ISR65_13610 [Bacteriovoracaceae bacterium]|nr:hypothetical protein [Bacteriovoracaceae bacterium]